MFKKKSVNEIGMPAVPPKPALVLLRLTETSANGLALHQWEDGVWREAALDDQFLSAFNPDLEVSAVPDTHPSLNLPEGCKALLLLPGNWVWSGVESIPKAARRQANAIGYMVEEQLAEDVEDLHFVCTPRNGDICSIYAISKDKMEILHSQVERLKWPLVAALPEYLLLDLLESDVSLWLDGDQAHVWQSSGQGLSIRREYLQPLLGSLLGEVVSAEVGADAEGTDEEAEGKKLLLLGAGEEDGLVVAELESLFADRLQMNKRSPEEIFLERYKPGKLSNLLSGDYQLASGKTESVWWVKPAKVAVFCFAAQLLFFVGAGAYYHWQAEQAEEQARAMFTEMFPNVRPSAQLRRQLNGFLKSAGNQGGAFSTHMQQLSKVWTEQRGKELQLQSLRFDGQRGEMVLQLKAQNLSDLDTFVSKLSGNGLRANLLGANELKEGVSGRVRVR
ncbi:type II secretion system protein GspL [Microbulbifer sp. THAF38]|uniref:type II secretion system protein GspL n=1 Tax=Microbulbifer sp. THAF38 TaxID=2587856 RepID=UPI001267A4E3|nr:type II secretion system protein GspL [Microbulbifer sp. THAF38]QFT54965.1 Type II secretion system protein L [Microbulbifer sp. THAF38]